jgi:hypothetical protein
MSFPIAVAADRAGKLAPLHKLVHPLLGRFTATKHPHCPAHL